MILELHNNTLPTQMPTATIGQWVTTGKAQGYLQGLVIHVTTSSALKPLVCETDDGTTFYLHYNQVVTAT